MPRKVLAGHMATTGCTGVGSGTTQKHSLTAVSTWIQDPALQWSEDSGLSWQFLAAAPLLSLPPLSTTGPAGIPGCLMTPDCCHSIAVSPTSLSLAASNVRAEKILQDQLLSCPLPKAFTLYCKRSNTPSPQTRKINSGCRLQCNPYMQTQENFLPGVPPLFKSIQDAYSRWWMCTPLPQFKSYGLETPSLPATRPTRLSTGASHKSPGRACTTFFHCHSNQAGELC